MTVAVFDRWQRTLWPGTYRTFAAVFASSIAENANDNEAMTMAKYLVVQNFDDNKGVNHAKDEVIELLDEEAQGYLDAGWLEEQDEENAAVEGADMPPPKPPEAEPPTGAPA